MWHNLVITPHLFVVKLLQLGQSMNSLLPQAFLCVGQDVWMNLEAENKKEIRASQRGILLRDRTRDLDFF